MDSDMEDSLPSSLLSLLNPAPRRSSTRTTLTSHSAPRDSSTRTTLTSHSEDEQTPRDNSTRATLSSHLEDSDQEDGPSLPFRPPFSLYVPSSTSNSTTAGDRRLQTVPSENPDYQSLEPSSNLNFPSSSLKLPELYFPSQSSPAPIHLPNLATLKARIYDPNSSWRWREGEAGPSSLIHPGQRDYDSRHHPSRHVASQPARVTSPPSTFGYGSMSREPQRRNTGYYPTSQQPIHDRPISPMQQVEHHGSIPPSHPGPERRFSYPQLDSLSISEPNYSRQVITPELEPSYGSEPVSVNIGSNEGDDTRKNKKRRAHSMDVNNIPKKPTRKTAVACNFCRGRKLRCNGAKPSCYNCTVRKFECEYVSTQRRRGPGKAPKGQRSRKGRSEPSGSGSNIGDRVPTTTVPDTVSPDLGPFLSVLTLETFQPPDPPPQHWPERPPR